MTTALHDAIAAEALDKPAFLISNALLADLMSRRMVDVLTGGIRTPGGALPQGFIGHYVAYPDPEHGPFQIGLESCSYSTAQTSWNLSVPPIADPGAFFISSATPFDVVFNVTKLSDATIQLFSVTLHVTEVQAIGTAGRNELVFKDVNVALSQTVDDANGLANIKLLGYHEAELYRLEGLVAYSLAPTMLRNVFSGAPPIALKSIFPAIAFNDGTRAVPVADGLLVIAAGGFELDETQRCPCGPNPPPIRLNAGEATDATAVGGTVPITVTLPPPQLSPVENSVSSEIALYLPQPTAARLTSGPYPAISDSARDNGFIGWSYDYTIAFNGVSVSFKDPRATLVLKIEFHVSGHGLVTVDLGCLGRKMVGMIQASNEAGGPSSVEIGLTPVLQPDGKIVLSPQILSLDVTEFRVDCYVYILTLLSYFGAWGSLAAFVINVIIERVIQHNLPIKLNSGLRDAMAKQTWTLIDLTKLDINAVFGSKTYLKEAISRRDDSLLVGLHAFLG